MTDIIATIQQLIADGAKKLLNREKSSEDMFLIYKNDFGEDSIDIIGRNIREFGELLYHQGHKLIARQESNLEFCIYLASFDGNSNFDESIKMIENLIEKKRKEEEQNVNNNWPMNRIVPELKVNNDKWEDMKDETARVQQTIDEFKTQTQATLNEMKDKYDTMTEKYDTTSEMIQFLQKQGIEREKRRTLKVDRFYDQRNLEYIRNSTDILKKMFMRLSVKNAGDDSRAEPPFKDISSMEDKKKELVAYFDLLQKNLDESTEVTVIQKHINEWLFYNWSQLSYKPTTSEKEECKKEMEQKLGVKNTIGTVCYMPLKHHGSFCIANSKIICRYWGASRQEALGNVHEALVNRRNWDTNAKFATDMEVSDNLSDYFVHVSTEEIMKISNNHKVMQWMTNNSEFLKYNVDVFSWLYSMTSIYNLALKYFEESIE